MSVTVSEALVAGSIIEASRRLAVLIDERMAVIVNGLGEHRELARDLVKYTDRVNLLLRTWDMVQYELVLERGLAGKKQEPPAIADDARGLEAAELDERALGGGG